MLQIHREIYNLLDYCRIFQIYMPYLVAFYSIILVFHPIHIKPSGHFYDFESKYKSNETEYLKADLKDNQVEEIKDIAWHAFSSLGCKDWGRVDFMQDEKGNFQIIEVNTVPGLTQTSLFPKAASFEGISFKDIIAQILLLACKGN